MSQDTKIILGIGLATVVLIIGGAFWLGQSSSKSAVQTASSSADPKLLIRSDSHQTASGSAQPTIVEFGDYQCPACGQAEPIVEQARKLNANFVFRNFPLPQHRNALISAEAAEAAGEQGKFWEMHDRLYQNQTEWSESTDALTIFTGYAKDLGLDTTKFKDEVTSNKFADQINQDKNDGLALGVDSTPTFFINGQKLVGVPSLDDFKNAIK